MCEPQWLLFFVLMFILQMFRPLPQLAADTEQSFSPPLPTPPATIVMTEKGRVSLTFAGKEQRSLCFRVCPGHSGIMSAVCSLFEKWLQCAVIFFASCRTSERCCGHFYVGGKPCCTGFQWIIHRTLGWSSFWIKLYIGTQSSSVGGLVLVIFVETPGVSSPKTITKRRYRNRIMVSWKINIFLRSEFAKLQSRNQPRKYK